jgi:hypothetical protein
MRLLGRLVGACGLVLFLAVAAGAQEEETFFSSRLDSGKRSEKISREGGSPVAENAVFFAQRWIAAHQRNDGGWSFKHGEGNKHAGPVNNPGTSTSTTGATGIALLTLLAHGESVKEGRTKDSVWRGLRYLTGKAKAVKLGPDDCADLSDGGSPTDHALAAAALAEAYGLTKDKDLGATARLAANFIGRTQDKKTGGWRATAEAKDPDLPTTCWQLVALSTGKAATLDFPMKDKAGTINYLNGLQKQNGATYAWLPRGAEDPKATAIGLLARIELGWTEENAPLLAGADFLAKQGPSKTDMVFNYHATQVLFHLGGERWKKWSAAMRDAVVNGQVKGGAYEGDRGSWWTEGAAPAEGGRLLETAYRCLTLECYYRFMPIVERAQ